MSDNTNFKNILSLYDKRNIQYFVDKNSIAYISCNLEPGKISLRLDSPEYIHFTNSIYLDLFETLPTGRDVSEAARTLNHRAINQGVKVQGSSNRVAGNTSNRIEIDLGWENRKTAVISKSGWSLSSALSLFPYSFGMVEQVNPVGQLSDASRASVLNSLREITGVDEQTFLVLVTALLYFLRPAESYPVLLVQSSDEETRKFVTRIVKDLIDPYPSNMGDNVITGNDAYLSVVEELPVRHDYRYPIIICSDQAVASLPKEAACKALVIDMDTTEGRNKKELEKSYEKFTSLRPQMIAALFDALSSILKNLPDTNVTTDLELLEIIRWTTSAEEILAVQKGSILTAVENNQLIASENDVKDNPVVTALLKLLENRTSWSGSTVTLYLTLYQLAAKSGHKKWPATEEEFTTTLNRLNTPLKGLGVDIELPETGSGSLLQISFKH